MKTLFLFPALVAALIFPNGKTPQKTPMLIKPASDARIAVSPGTVVNKITPWMTGSCIEDVNHEIYGGLYAQRIFGESFEEPPASPIDNWTAYGGAWELQKGALHVGASAGAKLVRQSPVVGDGSVACDVRFADKMGDNAGLILRVSDPRTGPDAWIGYEISFSIRNQSLVLGRHRNNWEPMANIPTPIEAGRWYRLRVDLQGATVRVFVDAAPKPLMEFTDDKAALPAGLVGVRTWNSHAAFRNLTITASGQTVTEPLGDADAGSRSTVSGMWDAVVTGTAQPHFSRKSGDAYNSEYWQEIVHRGGFGTVGIANRGLNRWGISVRQGQSMQGHLYLKGQAGVPVTVALQSADGARTYASQKLTATGNQWARRDFTLRPNATDPNARFALWLDTPGRVGVDQVYLSDTGKALFGGGPFRADIGDALKKQGLTFLRYGGTMVNAPEYRWKKMIGDRDKRPQYRGHWYPNSTNGFGIEEFLQFCEAARIEPAFAINIDETPTDAADLVEYLNGPATSVWGAKRAANGHPKPYNVRYIEIGNEEGLDGSADWYRRYLERFKVLYDAMRPCDPNVQYVIAAWWNPDEPLCKQIAQELNGKAALWDLHVGGDNLRDADDVDKTLTRMKQGFDQWIPGSSMRVGIFEENGNRHDLQRALGHARILNVTERHGDFVLMDCPANCLQPWEQNDNGWNQGQVFFTPDKVWGMPPYWAQQMASQNYQPLRVACETNSPNNDLDTTATKSADGKTLVLKIVNSGAAAHHAALNLGDFTPSAAPMEIWTLTGELTARNTPDSPEQIRSVRSHQSVSGATFDTTFPAHSYTILRLNLR